MSYLLDTNICIALLKKQDKELVKKLKFFSPGQFFLCSIVKAELLYGARNSLYVNDNLGLLEEFFKQFASLSFDDDCGSHYGVLRTILARAGTPIGANDLLIASIALQHRLVIVTRNRREFLRVPGLSVETW